MEIEKYLTDIKANFYFGEINKLEGDEHKEAFIKSCIFVFLLFENLIDEKIYILNKLDCKLFKIDKNKILYINKNILFNKIRLILSKIYDSEDCEYIFRSNKLCINIYCDPVDIKIYYMDKIEKLHNCNKPKKSFLDLLCQFKG